MDFGDIGVCVCVCLAGCSVFTDLLLKSDCMSVQKQQAACRNLLSQGKKILEARCTSGISEEKKLGTFDSINNSTCFLHLSQRLES